MNEQLNLRILKTKNNLQEKIVEILASEAESNNMTDKEKEFLDKSPHFTSAVICILESETLVKFDENDTLTPNEVDFPKIFGSIQTTPEKSKAKFLEEFLRF